MTNILEWDNFVTSKIKRHVTRKNPILGIILLFFFSLPSFAQNVSNILEGTVRDIKGKPIELATVSLNNVIGSHTDRNGHYKLTRLKEGTYQYRVSFIGYETVTGTVHVQSSKTRLNVTLKELSLNLKNVTVTARQEQMGSKSLIGEDAIRHVQPKKPERFVAARTGQPD